MAHYAYLDENNIVTQVIVGKDEGEDGIDWEQYYGAKRTSYNTFGGIHYDPNTGQPSSDQSQAFRYNFAAIGYVFLPNVGEDGAFASQQPYPSWTLDPQTAWWQPPTPMPETEGTWSWDEDTLSWVDATPAG